MSSSSTQAFRAARDFLLAQRGRHDAALAGFQWPSLQHFNWALDWFDVLARDNHATALWVVHDDGSEQRLSFAQMAERSNRVAHWLRSRGVKRGDRMLLMLGNVVPLWELTLAAIKLGAVVSPATTLLSAEDLRDRVQRGRMRHVIADADAAARFDEVPGDYTRTQVGGAPRPGWTDYADCAAAGAAFAPDGATRADDPLLLYFTSGTTAKPKMVLHTQASYPVGHLSTMYWLGLQPGDVHLNISSPGWAKHAWSCFFAPWNAGACVFIFNQPRFNAATLIEALATHPVTSLCAPPTVWRMLIQQDLAAARPRLSLRELIGAGEPLNPEVIERVRAAWGLTIRDGYGQTETTAQVGNAPGQRVVPGSMGKPLPGYTIELLDADGKPADEGELSICLEPRPLGLMPGYHGDAARTNDVMQGGYYRTGDVARRDADGSITYVGRADDVFKASDYRISPFELESALIEHPAVAEAAVVPSPDPVRGQVPKAYVILAAGHQPDAATAADIFRFMRQRVSGYKLVRRIEFSDLPKTISGKIRRVDLRRKEEARAMPPAPGSAEFFE